MSLMARLDSPVRNEFSMNNRESVDSIRRGGKLFTLCLEGLPSIDIPYHFSSGLPIAKVIPGECSPSVHLSLLTDDNNNLTGGQKVLLEWHYRFGHL